MNRRLPPALVALGLIGALGAGACAARADAASGRAAPDRILIRTDAGPVSGAATDGTRTFTGIPYAAPPIGDLRWRPPRPATPWTSPLDATRPAPLCAQQGDHLGTSSLAEDCLYLNVTTPHTASPHGPRPVIVWLHGGSFKDGGGHLYPARRLAAQGDVVVVTVNYRLGALGFLAHPLLDDADRGGASGNFGLADQQAALRWVQRNATAFGGDPGNVTLAGESAGGTSVCAHLATPASAGLFHRAIIQSAPCVSAASAGAGSGNEPRSRHRAEEQGQQFVAALDLGGDVTGARLRDPELVSPAKLLAAAATAGSAFGPVVGGDLLPVEPARAIASGRINRVPVLHGINRDEQRLQVWGYETAKYGGPVPAEQYPAEVRQVFGADTARVLRHYPLHRHDSASHALAALLTDAQHAASTVETSRQLSRRVPTFTYEFADDDAPWFSDFAKPYPMGAYHAAELPYLFDVRNTEPLTAAQQQLARRMVGYWAAFARTGVPAAPGSPPWRGTTPGRLSIQALDVGGSGIGPTDFTARHRYGFWSTVGKLR
ncbi:carboxylesterase/lipase family protein [Actinoplanes sp. DH11]|uniref:carboxylesterase/lipase family protein n=1 Tax=Actinoplanes sp. DH11 TaxID=2857011 RepID=UPI001E51883D|nr:carboxylesterase family protein [Actinoplanes sp. DH11]